jgi:crotonobetainyl-CoA:carnitine CoA-transferase CaiB-like acyl-CoA transferase
MKPDPAGITVVAVEQADVFIHNLKPGLLAELGFGAASLRVKLPRLIGCEITDRASALPHLRSARQQTPAGDIRVVPPAPIVNGSDSPSSRKSPELGEHTVAIRKEFFG